MRKYEKTALQLILAIENNNKELAKDLVDKLIRPLKSIPDEFIDMFSTYMQ